MEKAVHEPPYLTELSSGFKASPKFTDGGKYKKNPYTFAKTLLGSRKASRYMSASFFKVALGT